jgi:hypothetical protein
MGTVSSYTKLYILYSTFSLGRRIFALDWEDDLMQHSDLESDLATS